MDESIRGTQRSRLKTIALFVLVPILGVLGVLAQQKSLDIVREIRVLERIPPSSILASLPGPNMLFGEAMASTDHALVEGHWTDTPCIWFRAVKEVESTDSEGNTSWDIVFDTQSSVPFRLDDSTGIIPVVPNDEIDFIFNRKWRNTKGSTRFTEYRIDVGDAIHMVGMLTNSDDVSEITFPSQGAYLPIVSDRSIAGARASRAVSSTFLTILSVFLMGASCACLLLGIRVFNTLGFAAMVGAVEICLLTCGGVVMMSHDLRTAQETLESQFNDAHEIALRGFEKLNLTWNGEWQDQSLFEAAEKRPAPGPRLAAMRMSLASRTDRTQEIRARFPQNLLGWTIGLPATPSVLNTNENLSASEGTIPIAYPFWLWPVLITVVSILLAAIGIGVGYSTVRTKRCIENVPTTPAGEVAIGTCEVKGVLKQCPDIPSLSGPLTNHACTWYRYLIQEWQGSGKNRHLVTISDKTKRQIFLCHDDSGSIPIDAADAEVISGRLAKTHRGGQVHSEWSLREDDPLYILGSAELDPHTGDSLRIHADDQNLPFIISNLPEKRINGMKTATAFWLLAVGIASVAATILGLLMFTGRVAAVDQLTAALASTTAVGLLVLMIIFNDLVFLRERVYWAKSNILVALKKRKDLIPQLESISKGYMGYEKDVQSSIAHLRSAWATESESPHDATPSIQESLDATTNLLAIREAYPDLKANVLTNDLMKRIVTLENEISARRAGYNATVERYLARTRTVPDVVIAKLFKFQPEELLNWDNSIRSISPLNFAPNQRPEEELGIEEIIEEHDDASDRDPETSTDDPPEKETD